MITYGVDVSRYQKGFRIDGRPLITFCYAKATEGHTYVDAEYFTYKGMAESTGKLFAAYHFLHSDSAPAAQARHYMSVEPDKRIPVIIDVEPTPDGLSKPGLIHASMFARTLLNNGYSIGALYLPQWWWERIGSPSLIGSLAGPHLIASNYGANPYAYPTDIYTSVTDARWNAYGNKTPTILQYGSRGHFPGYGGTVDVNAFRGDRAALAATGIFFDFSAKKIPVPVPPRPTVPQSDHERILDLTRRVSNLENLVKGKK